MENISIQYPAWYLVLCVALGLIYALGLYYKDKTFAEQYPRLPKLLGIVRFLSVSLLAFLLLKPTLKTIETDTQKPVIVLAQDESESVGAALSEEALERYKKDWEALREKLATRYEVKEYDFGSKVRERVHFEMTDKVTNISKLMTYLGDLYTHQNLGAVVLATDGIYNEGSNPLYSNTRLNVPLYAIALGDTVPKKDLNIKRVFHNKIAYLGDKFSVEVDLMARNAAGNATRMTVSKMVGNQTIKLQEVPLQIDKNDFFTTRQIILDANESGVQRYRITLAPVAGEASTANNVKEFYVDVLDARQKLLILANAPHPDISGLRQVLEKNKNYQVSVNYIGKIKEKLEDFDFVVLHNLPSTRNDLSGVMNTLNSRKIPRMFIVGSQTDLPRFNRLQPLLTIKGSANNPNPVQALINPDFNLFTISEKLRNNLPVFNPIMAPFGDFTARSDARVLLYQRIGKVDTKYPLLLFGEDNETKIVVLAAEGLWRWRLFDFLQHQNHDIYKELIGKVFQYATLKSDKRRFRVALSKNIFDENEPIIFDAELYNESYELVNDPDVSLTITDSEGREFHYTFDRTTNAYSLSAGILPTGNYSFRAHVNYNGQNLDYNGQFSVRPIQLELYQTTANHNLLRLLATEYGGTVFYQNQLDQLGDAILAKDIKPILYTSTRTRSVINLKWIFFLLLGLLSMEWFLRRYYGGY